MDDSDEYFDDSFTLDEAALASIQATEERFGAHLSQARHSQLAVRASSPSPAKRLKTSHGSLENGIARVPPRPVFKRMGSLELNPEIRVGPDGNYVVSTPLKAVTTQFAKSSGGPSGLTARPQAKLNCNTLSGGGGLASDVAVLPSISHPMVVPAEGKTVTDRFSHLHDNRHHYRPYSRFTPSQESSRSQAQALSQKQTIDQRTTTNIHSVNEWGSSTASQRRARIIEQVLAETATQPQVSATTTSHDIPKPDPTDIQAELASVRAQLEALNAENAAMQKSLRDAQDAQLVKAGEVSILRQTIDKTKKEHAEAIAKAKADMIAHEKVKSELHAKLKEETERMATRLVFQQHEMETSTRKPAWGSGRSRRTTRDSSISNSVIAATPTRSQKLFPPPSTHNPSGQISRGKYHQVQQQGTPLTSPATVCRPTRSRDDVKQPRFKGFHNAFIDAEPVIPQSPVISKDENMEEDEGWDPFLTSMKPSDSLDVDSRDPGKEKWEEPGREVDEQDLMVDEEGVDWGEELRRIVFTHMSPQNDELTLHILLSTAIPSQTSREMHAYKAACQVILETCGTKHGHTPYFDDSGSGDVIHKIADAFVIVGSILTRAGCLGPLSALLDLLLLLTLYIPAFLAPFLGPPTSNTVVDHSDNDTSPQLLCMLCDVVREHLVPPKPHLNVDKTSRGEENMRAVLAMGVVQLMESLCWTVKDHHLVDRLGVLPRQPRVFEILLDPAQSPDLIVRTLQLLVLLATHRDVVQHILVVSESDTANNEQGSLVMKDPSSLVEKLCYYLVESAAEETYRIRHLVVALISILAHLHVEARTILLDSVTLAPSLVVCIAKLSRLLWEDDPGIMDTPKLAKLTVDILYSSVNLLHHLVFVLNLSPVLGRKLIEATRLPGPFNGVAHMFIVTFGRLSWAEGPEWLDKDSKDRCEIIAEYAMEIIETVVPGPECDSLWAVWHQLEVTDEEEFEAWKIQTD